MKKVVTFGEIMARFTPVDHEKLFNSTVFSVCNGGAESNVSVFLAFNGIDTEFVSSVPDNELGMMAIMNLNKYGVDTSKINKKPGERMGTYYLQPGFSQRPSKVIYDRANSAFSNSNIGDYNWKEIFKDAVWFHFTGITPALGENIVEITLEALKEAKKNNVKVSCDLNFRKNLWSEKRANEVMTELMEYVDILFANEEDSERVFGIKSKNSDVEKGTLKIEDYEFICNELKRKFNFESVAITMRESILANINRWSAICLYGEEFFVSDKYDIHIIDRVGGGDSFASGFIYGTLNEMNPEDIVNFAVASSCLKHTIPGDFNVSTAEEVLALKNGSGSGRISR